MLLYIHGFNSSPASRTFGLLRAAFAQAQALSYPCHGMFKDNLAALLQQAETLGAAQASAVLVTGSSLGGFYAAQVAAALSRHRRVACTLFNPVVFPAKALSPFVGRNTHFHTGQPWQFTRPMLESYAAFTDPRPHLNGPVLLVLGRNDELLNPAEARSYWHGVARLHETDDGHSLAALDSETLQALAAAQKA